MDAFFLRARVMTMLLPALVGVRCTIEGLPPDPQEGSLTAGAGGSAGAGSSDESPSAGNSTGGRTSTPNPGDEGGSSAQATGGSAEAGQDAAGGSTMHTGGSAQTGGMTGQGAFPAGGRAAGGGGTADGGAGTGGGDESGSGGTAGTGGTTTGGFAGTGGIATGGSGGVTTGGRSNTGGSAGTGGAATGGKGGTATGGAPTGGSGGAATGGSGGAATGGASSTGGSSAVDCSGTMPTGGTNHCLSDSGTAGSLQWSLWSSLDGACMTTYDSPAFSASWNGSGDTLARLGLEWGSAGKTYEEHGTITAQFAFEKTGSGGSLSFIGVYGWSENPCIEYYIIDDSFSQMPVNPGNTTEMGTAEIDGGTYRLYTRLTSGIGGSRCTGVSNWKQFYSIRQTARQCGQISVTEHFDAWDSLGMMLGELLEVTILVEVLGGSGSIDFATANVTVQ